MTVNFSWLHKFNTENYWPIWIGLLYFTGITIMTKLNLGVSHILPWKNASDILLSTTKSNIAGLIIVVFLTLSALWSSRRSLNYHPSQQNTSKLTDGLGCYFILCMLLLTAKLIGSNSTLKDIGLGDSIWAIAIGCTIRTIITFCWNEATAKSWIVGFLT